jgi:hypothetical protein
MSLREPQDTSHRHPRRRHPEPCAGASPTGCQEGQRLNPSSPCTAGRMLYIASGSRRGRGVRHECLAAGQDHRRPRRVGRQGSCSSCQTRVVSASVVLEASKTLLSNWRPVGESWTPSFGYLQTKSQLIDRERILCSPGRLAGSSSVWGQVNLSAAQSLGRAVLWNWTTLLSGTGFGVRHTILRAVNFTCQQTQRRPHLDHLSGRYSHHWLQ